MATKGAVLVLGAGLVTKPLVHYLSEHGWHVILASRTVENAEKLIDGAAHAEAHQFDITQADHSKLDEWTQRSVAVISMLPYVRRESPQRRLFFCRDPQLYASSVLRPFTPFNLFAYSDISIFTDFSSIL